MTATLSDRNPRAGREQRVVPMSDVELRDADDGTVVFEGYAAVYNSPSAGLAFREVILPGAFDETLAAGPDVRLLAQHDPATVMARTTAGDLELTADDVGLHVRAVLNLEDPDVARVVPKLRAGHIDGMSFAFWVMPGGSQRVELPDGTIERQLTRLDIDGGDVAIVTYPAYPATSAVIRSADTLAQLASAPASRAARDVLAALPPDFDVPAARDVLERMEARAVELTHDDLWVRLDRALQQLLGDETYDYWWFIRDVGDDWLVFRARNYAGGTIPTATGYFRVAFTVDDAGNVTLDPDWVEVLPRTVYDPVQAPPEADPVDVEDRSGDTPPRMTVDQARRRLPLRNRTQGAPA